MRTVLFLAALAPCFMPQEKTADDAEALFRKVEKRLQEGSAIHLKFKHETRQETDIRDVCSGQHITWWKASGFRREWTMESGHLAQTPGDKNNDPPAPSPKEAALDNYKRNFQEHVSILLSGGIQATQEAWCPLLKSAPAAGEKPSMPYSVVSGFKWLPKEKGDAQPIEFTLTKTYAFGVRTRGVKVWIDCSTLTPTKLEATYVAGKTTRVSTETYTTFSRN